MPLLTMTMMEMGAVLPPEDLPIAAVFLTGRPFPEADQRATGIGWAAMATAVAEEAELRGIVVAPGQMKGLNR